MHNTSNSTSATYPWLARLSAPRAKTLVTLVALGGAAALGLKLHGEHAIPSAVAAEASPPHARGVVAEGRVATYPGGFVTLGTEMAGRLVKVGTEKDHVHRGDVVAEVASEEQRAALVEASARAEEARSDRAFLGREADRARTLFGSGTVAFAGFDRADHDQATSKARYETVLADAARLKAVVDKAKIASPIDGTILERRAEPGETVPAGAPVLVVADLSRLRIEAEIDEYDAAKIRLGQEVDITAEGYPGAHWRGKVEEIPDQVVSRRLKPQDPGRPTDTRVLLVKVGLLETSPVFLGQRVEVEVLTGRGE